MTGRSSTSGTAAALSSSGAIMKRCCSRPWNTRSDLGYWLEFGGEDTACMSYAYRGGDDPSSTPNHVQFLKANARRFLRDRRVHLRPRLVRPGQADDPAVELDAHEWEFVQPDENAAPYFGEDRDRRPYSPDRRGSAGSGLSESYRHQRMSWGMANGLGSRLGYRYSGR